MTERQPVKMVRLGKQEELYDVEDVLGRDAASVFPSMNKQLDPVEQLKVAIGAKKFVTETELEEIKAARGLTVDDGTIAADKPLAEVLAERKKAKQDAFEEQWKQMKTGKNRPLEPEELDFLDALAKHEARQMATMQQQEAAELEAYRLAVAAAAEAKAAAAAIEEGGETTAAAAAAGPGGSAVLGRSGSGGATAARVYSRVNSKAVMPVVKPTVLKVKPKPAGGQTAGAAEPPGNSSKRPRIEHDADDEQQRRQQQHQHQQQQKHAVGEGCGLAGLLGEYGSCSEEDV